MRKAGERPYVRLRTIFGQSVVPPDAANVIIRAVNRAVAVGDVSRHARWQLIEFMAANYLNDQRQQRAFLVGEPIDPRPLESAVSPAVLAERLAECHPDEADDLLVEALRSLGYEDAMVVYQRAKGERSSLSP